MAEIARGGIAPLLDRLASVDEAVRPVMLESQEGLQESIQRELGALFSTRSPLALSEYVAHAHTVLEYGIPDFSSVDAADLDQLARLGQALRTAVERYEPRLLDVKLGIEPAFGRPATAVVRLAAQARLGMQLRPMEFELLLGATGSQVKVA